MRAVPTKRRLQGLHREVDRCADRLDQHHSYVHVCALAADKLRLAHSREHARGSPAKLDAARACATEAWEAFSRATNNRMPASLRGEVERLQLEAIEAARAIDERVADLRRDFSGVDA